MIEVTVRLLGELRWSLDCREVVLELEPGSTVRDAVDALWKAPLVRQAGSADVCRARGSGCVIFLNGRNAESLDGRERVLRAGDRLAVTAPMGGG